MHKKLLTWVVMMGMAVFAAQVVHAQGSEQGRIVLARVTGQVTLTNKADSTTRTAVNNEQIVAGYIVTTAADASVVLVFSNGSTVNLREDSVLDIETFMQDPFADDFRIAEATAEPSTSTTRLNLNRGEIIGNVKTLNSAGGSSFTVQTPVGAAGIRGTTFRIVFRPDGTGRAFFSLTTVEGNVVLTQGTVEIPVAAINDQAVEIAVEIDVQVDPATGAITVATGGQAFTVQPAAAASTAEIIQSAQQIVDLVAAIAFTPPVPAPTPPPPPAPPPPRTTTADGADD